MGSIEARLRHLEARTGRGGEGAAATTRKVMKRLTVEELRAYVSALQRMKAGEELVEEDRPILQRVEELRREVGN